MNRYDIKKRILDLLDYDADEIIEQIYKFANEVQNAIVFPCEIGDPVWLVGTTNANKLKRGVIETTVEKLILKSGGVYMKLACNAMYETSCRSIGKTVFFSLEEAEAALAEGGDELCPSNTKKTS